MKLKEIPNNIVVHTPTEEEAKELLAILHENGYKWANGEALNEILRWKLNGNKTCHKIYIGDMTVTYSDKDWFKKNEEPILTLAEFKERYLVFEVGDKVRINADILKITNIVRDEQGGFICRAEDGRTWNREELEPYTGPETKDEAIEKEPGEKGNNSGKSRLDLCELLRGHKTEYFYSPLYGRMSYTSERDGLLYFESLQGEVITLFPNGHSQFTVEGYCGIFPSRALYEQYPLDAYTAWMKWQEEQKKIILQICYAPLIPDNIPLQAQQTVMANLNFRTPADRDKCIEEINKILNSYAG